MPANEFEKSVQERLDDFQLNPSAAVWKNVEAQIRNKKKRRFVLFFLIPLLVGSGALLLVLIKSSSPGNIAQDGSHSPEKSNNSNREVENGNDRQMNAGGTEGSIPGNIKASSAETTINLSTKDEATVIETPTVKKNISKEQFKITTKKSTSAKNNRPENNKTDEISIVENQRLQPAKPLEESASMPALPVGEKKTETLSNINPVEDSMTKKKMEADSTKTKEDVKSPKPIVTSRKWQWGLESSLGMSSIRTDVLSVSVLAPMSDYYQNVPGVGSGGPSSITPPSIIRPGTTFSFGGFASTRVSGRINFTVGLRYSYMSTNQKAGARKDTVIRIENGANDFSSANGYYDAAPTKNFTNRFHYVQVPLAAHWKVSNRFPLYATLGANVGYLVKTNALIYNPSRGGLYFHDKKAFNRMNFALSTGISYGLKLKNSELQLGPVLSMDMTRLVKENFDTRGYLLYGGINVRFLFPEKKRR